MEAQLYGQLWKMGDKQEKQAVHLPFYEKEDTRGLKFMIYTELSG
jgi:hypothetical protein